MKLAFRDIEPFVNNPNVGARVILVYGPDNGLMQERCRTMGMSIVDDYNDPFNVAVIAASELPDDPAKLSDEANAISMMGGKRLIRVTDAADKLTVLVKEYLANPNDNSVILLQAGELSPRSSLRKLCESDKAAAAVPCYVEDERDLARLIRETMQGANLQIEQDAIMWLASNISGNRQKARGELEKLITYMGEDGARISLLDVQACCGQAGASSLDNLVYGASGSNPALALKSYEQLISEGVNFIVVLRSLQNHFRRMHMVKSRLAAGEDIDGAMKKLSPPIFFKQAPIFKGQIHKWSLPALSNTLDRLCTLEAQCKTTSMPVETLCSQALLSISKFGMRSGARR